MKSPTPSKAIELDMFAAPARIASAPILFWFGPELWAFHMLLEAK